MMNSGIETNLFAIGFVECLFPCNVFLDFFRLVNFALFDQLIDFFFLAFNLLQQHFWIFDGLCSKMKMNEMNCDAMCVNNVNNLLSFFDFFAWLGRAANSNFENTILPSSLNVFSGLMSGLMSGFISASSPFSWWCEVVPLLLWLLPFRSFICSFLIDLATLINCFFNSADFFSFFCCFFLIVRSDGFDFLLFILFCIISKRCCNSSADWARGLGSTTFLRAFNMPFDSSVFSKYWSSSVSSVKSREWSH